MYFNEIKLEKDTTYKLSITPSISGVWKKYEDSYLICRYIDTIIKDNHLNSYLEGDEWDPDDLMCNGVSYDTILIFRKLKSDREVRIPASWIIEIEPV